MAIWVACSCSRVPGVTSQRQSTVRHSPRVARCGTRHLQMPSQHLSGSPRQSRCPSDGGTHRSSMMTTSSRVRPLSRQIGRPAARLFCPAFAFRFTLSTASRETSFARSPTAQLRPQRHLLPGRSIPGVASLPRQRSQAPLRILLTSNNSRSVGAWIGLSTPRYQSGEIDYDEHISKRSDAHRRGLSMKAATVMMARAAAESDLRS